ARPLRLRRLVLSRTFSTYNYPLADDMRITAPIQAIQNTRVTILSALFRWRAVPSSAELGLRHLAPGLTFQERFAGKRLGAVLRADRIATSGIQADASVLSFGVDDVEM